MLKIPHVYIRTYIYICIYVYTYTYIYRERETKKSHGILCRASLRVHSFNSRRGRPRQQRLRFRGRPALTATLRNPPTKRNWGTNWTCQFFVFFLSRCVGIYICIHICIHTYTYKYSTKIYVDMYVLYAYHKLLSAASASWTGSVLLCLIVPFFFGGKPTPHLS